MAFPSSSASVPSLSQWQVSYQGVTLGAGTNYGIKEIDGFDLNAWRSGDTPRARDHGELPGLDLVPGRTVTVTFDILPTSFVTSWVGLANGTVPQSSEQPFWLNLPGWGQLAMMAKPRKRSMPLTKEVSLGPLAKTIVEWHGTDPRLYTSPTLTASCGLSGNPAGFSFPFSFPFSFGGASTINTISWTNAGNMDIRPILTVTGPCTSPSVQLTAPASLGGPYLNFPGLVMNAGDQLVIDTDLRTVTYFTAGSTIGADRRNYLGAGFTWWSLQPAVAGVPTLNTILFTSADSGPVAGTLTVAAPQSGWVI